MGIVPLQFLPGQSAETLKLTGKEKYTIKIPHDCQPLQHITVEVNLFFIFILFIYLFLLNLKHSFHTY